MFDCLEGNLLLLYLAYDFRRRKSVFFIYPFQEGLSNNLRNSIAWVFSLSTRKQALHLSGNRSIALTSCHIPHISRKEEKKWTSTNIPMYCWTFIFKLCNTGTYIVILSPYLFQFRLFSYYWNFARDLQCWLRIKSF